MGVCVCVLRMYVSHLMLRMAPFSCKWGIISTLLAQVIDPQASLDIYKAGPESYIAFRYVEDGTFYEPFLGRLPWKSLFLWGYAISKCLGPVDAHIQKREIEGNSDAEVEILGITVSAVNNTSSLPPAKIDKADGFIISPTSTHARHVYPG